MTVETKMMDSGFHHSQDNLAVPNTPGNNTQKSAKKKKKAPVSIEDVFSQVSSVTASNLNAPPGRVLLTPRSAEACLKLGVNPELLKIRDIDSFWEAGLDPSVQRIRHEAYVQRRHDLMKQCRLERKRTMNAEQLNASQVAASSASVGSPEGLSPERILQMQAEQTSTLIQQEKKRIEKMQQRQERELEQMIQVINHSSPYITTLYTLIYMFIILIV